MAWLGKVSLGGFPDLAEAVTKLSESVKNIEKNFDSALGLEEKCDSGEASELWPSATDKKALHEPGGESDVEPLEKVDSSECSSSVQEQEGIETDVLPPSVTEQVVLTRKSIEALKSKEEEEHLHSEQRIPNVVADLRDAEADSQPLPVKMDNPTIENTDSKESFDSLQQKERPEMGSSEESQLVEANLRTDELEQVETNGLSMLDESHHVSNSHESHIEQKKEAEEIAEKGFPVQDEVLDDDRQVGFEIQTSILSFTGTEEGESSSKLYNTQLPNKLHLDQSPVMVAESVSHPSDSHINTVEVNQQANDFETDTKEQCLSSGTTLSDSVDSVVEMEKVKMEMKMMEAALQGAARQAQAKADEIAELMTENEQLNVVIEDQKRKSNESETESLREEYHQRLAALERKVYALTKERDTLRREQSRKSDAAALLKENDEIINQVMAEGEELSKKQAAQESQIRKLRAQVREFEEEKKGLITKFQVEESKVESIKRDKAETEKLLQETIEKHQLKKIITLML